MKKTIKMILKEDFEKTYQPKLKVTDVIEKTAYFRNNFEEQLSKNDKALKHYKLSFRLSTIMSIILLFVVIGLGYRQWKWKNTTGNRIEAEVLTDEYYNYMLSINPYVTKNYQYTIRINDNASMYIYKGLDVKKKVSDYFYIVHFSNTKSEPISIAIDSQEINIDKTSCGHLEKLSIEEGKALHFVINVDGLSKAYTIVD